MWRTAFGAWWYPSRTPGIFVYVLPPLQKSTSIDDIEMFVPNSLQMGWCESPPFFCSGLETARDFMEKLRTVDLPPHGFEHYMIQNIDPLRNTTDSEGLVTLLEVYVDDFMSMSNNTSHAHLLQIPRSILHGIHSIFPPPSVTGHNRCLQVPWTLHQDFSICNSYNWTRFKK